MQQHGSTATGARLDPVQSRRALRVSSGASSDARAPPHCRQHPRAGTTRLRLSATSARVMSSNAPAEDGGVPHGATCAHRRLRARLVTNTLEVRVREHIAIGDHGHGRRRRSALDEVPMRRVSRPLRHEAATGMNGTDAESTTSYFCSGADRSGLAAIAHEARCRQRRGLEAHTGHGRPAPSPLWSR